MPLNNNLSKAGVHGGDSSENRHVFYDQKQGQGLKAIGAFSMSLQLSNNKNKDTVILENLPLNFCSQHQSVAMMCAQEFGVIFEGL